MTSIDRFIPEVALSHDGSVALAHWYIDRLADLGCRRVKFQYHVPERETWQRWRTPDGRPPVPFISSRVAYLARTQFVDDDWRSLHQHAHARELLFGVSVFCAEAASRVYAMRVCDFWKVPRTLSRCREVYEAVNGIVLRANSESLTRVFVSCLPDHYTSGVQGLWEGYPSRLDPIYLLCDGLEPTTLESCVALTDGDGISYHASDPAPALHHLWQGRYVEAHVQFVPGLQVPDAPWSLDETQVAMIVEGCR
jgi:N-acetylneuraminate synthase